MLNSIKGIPLRIEIGPKDIENKKFVAVRRDLLKKETYEESNAADTIAKLLDTIHNDLYDK